MNPAEDYTAFLLAGGNSSRMGSDKGLMPWNGTTMAACLIEMLRSCFRNVVVISGKEEYLRFGLPVIQDQIKGLGPAGGILSGLRYSDTRMNFFIACDIPNVTPEVIRVIIQRSDPEKISVPVLHNRLEPLCGFYPKSLADEWEKQVKSGLLKMHFLLMKFNVNRILLDDRFAGSNIFENINSIDDYNRLIKAENLWK